jgi:hypothetical protein
MSNERHASGPIRTMLRLSRRAVGLHGNSLSNARNAVDRDDAARAHRESVAADVAEHRAATRERAAR